MVVVKALQSNSSHDLPIGVLTALEAELNILRAQIKYPEIKEIAGFTFYVGMIDKQNVVLSQSAAGKVNASALATLMAYVFECRALVFSGVAGGLNPAKSVGDIVIADRVIQHDYAAVIDGEFRVYHPGDHCIGERTYALPYKADLELISNLKANLQGVSFGTILTGDQFVNCEQTRKRLFSEFKADAVEMEGGAVAQVATRFGLPWIVIRCLSDLAGDESHMDFNAFLKEAADKAAIATLQILALSSLWCK